MDDDDPDNPPPEMPRGLWLTLSWDVTGQMRPDEHLNQRAMRWTQAQHDQRVRDEAMADVHAEAEGFGKQRAVAQAG